MFQTVEIPPVWQDVPIYITKPDLNLREFGVDFTDASKDGLHKAYKHGKNKGKEFIEQANFI